MYPIHSYAVFGLYTILGLSMIALMIYGGINRMKALGTPSIYPLFFYTSKIAFGLCLGFFLLKALIPDLGIIHPPVWASWAGVVLLFFSTIYFIWGFISLGRSLMVGLPDYETKLKTAGIYRISRNPIYLAVILLCTGSCLYFPEPGNIAVAVYAIWFHHKIILAEEKFLENRFGETWTAYRKHVRRYL